MKYSILFLLVTLSVSLFAQTSAQLIGPVEHQKTQVKPTNNVPPSTRVMVAKPHTFFDVSLDSYGDIDDDEADDHFLYSLEKDRPVIQEFVKKNACAKKLGAKVKALTQSKEVKKQMESLHRTDPLVDFGFQLAFVEEYFSGEQRSWTKVCGMREISVYVMFESQSGKLHRHKFRITSEDVSLKDMVSAIQTAAERPIFTP